MLRDYQAEICSKVEDALKKERSVMMQMPTGTGKTIVLAELVKRQLDFLPYSDDDGCRVLIVAHRIELIEQTGDNQNYTIINKIGRDVEMKESE